MNKFLRQPETYVAKGDSKWSSWFDEAPDSMTDALQDPLNTGCFCSDSICKDA